jgi:hypothetical protein
MASDGEIFLGGSGNPYNYNGIGYDGKPSLPDGDGFAYLQKNGVGTLTRLTEVKYQPSMDHRALLHSRAGLLIVGGMGPDQRVSDRIQIVPYDRFARAED